MNASGTVAERQHHLVDTVVGKVGEHALDHRDLGHGNICFGVVNVSGRRRVPSPPTSTTALMGQSGRGRIGAVVGGVVSWRRAGATGVEGRRRQGGTSGRRR